MKNTLHKLVPIILACGFIFAMTAVVSAAEYHIDDIEAKEKMVLHPGDTIVGSETPDLYFTTIDMVGNHWYNPANDQEENTMEMVHSMGADSTRDWIIFGPGSTYQVGNIAGFYSYPVEVSEFLVESTDADGNPISIKVLVLSSQPEDPILYKIHYDANGGHGSINVQEWIYAERENALSDGKGFEKDGHTLVGWTLPGALDENGEPIVWDLGESLDLGPGENIVGSMIPRYADATIDGKADITFQAVWEESDIEKTEIEESEITEEEQDVIADVTPVEEEEEEKAEDTEVKTEPVQQPAPEVEKAPATGDAMQLLLFTFILMIAGLGTALLSRNHK